MEVSRTSAVQRSLWQVRASWFPTLLAALVVGGIALLPRVAGLADFLTTDEAYHWITRTERFSHAIATRQWAETRLTGHPGVTLMWLGSLGLALERLAVANGWASVTSPVEHLAWLRFPPALLHALALPPAYLLLRRLVHPLTALIAALLWATSPYLIAHARLLHLDALLTTFVTFSLLCVLVACRAVHPRRWMVGAGVCAGLALLTKGPALILLPGVGLLLLWHVPAHSPREWLQRSITHYLLWLGVAALVVLLLWPTLWVVPGRAFDKYISEIIVNGGRPNGAGQFFRGQAIADPGPLFYPVVNVFRLTPLQTLGLLALPLAVWRSARDRRILFALGAFVLFWTLVMTLGPKKFDRYVLPTWPALLVLAAAGLTSLLEGGWRLAGHLRQEAARRVLATISLASLLILLIQPVITYHPYYLSYYNPLTGGGASAQRNLLIGWGEGMDQVGAYLRSRPDLGYGPVLSALPRTLEPFVPVPVKSVIELDQDTQNYAVVYLESIQRGAHPTIYAQIQQTVPLHRVTIHGIDYAWIYQLPKPFEQAVGAHFGSALHLRGVTVTSATNHLVVEPAWDVRGPLPADYNVFLHLIDGQGRRVAQIDVDPGGADFPQTSAWEPGQQIAVPLPLPLPDNLPAGVYRIVLGLYDVTTGARLRVTEGPVADPALAGANALLLAAVSHQ